MSSTAKAKTAKLSELVSDLRISLNLIFIVRTLLDYFNTIPGSQQVQIKVLTDNINWARTEKRIFLKHSLETRLVALYV
jgi:26S proteasome regulatory subunit N6